MGLRVVDLDILPHYYDIVSVTLFVLLLSAIGTSGCICWAIFGAAFEKLFGKYRKPINLIMAVLLVYCAVSLFL